MAAPQRKVSYRPRLKEAPSARAPGKGPVRGRTGLRRGRAFLALVVVPVVLMLGSVYVHTVAAGLGTEVARLEEEMAVAEGEGERLEVRVTELSEPGRIRDLAREDLGMRDPRGEDLEDYDGSYYGEDVADGGEKQKGTGE